MPESHWKRYDRMEREAVDRLDVLETDLPRGVCSVKGCERTNQLYPFAGIGDRTFWVCSRHRPLYRKHNEILRRINMLSTDDVRLTDETRISAPSYR